MDICVYFERRKEQCRADRLVNAGSCDMWLLKRGAVDFTVKLSEMLVSMFSFQRRVQQTV